MIQVLDARGIWRVWMGRGAQLYTTQMVFAALAPGPVAATLPAP